MDSDINSLGNPEGILLPGGDEATRKAYLEFARRVPRVEFTEMEPLKEWFERNLDSAAEDDDFEEPGEGSSDDSANESK